MYRHWNIEKASDYVDNLVILSIHIGLFQNCEVYRVPSEWGSVHVTDRQAADQEHISSDETRPLTTHVEHRAQGSVNLDMSMKAWAMKGNSTQV